MVDLPIEWRGVGMVSVEGFVNPFSWGSIPHDSTTIGITKKYLLTRYFFASCEINLTVFGIGIISRESTT